VLTTVFVLFKCELGLANKVAADLVDNVPHISEVYSISGAYDLLAKFAFDRGIDVGNFVTEVVQVRPGVKDTHTIMTFSPFNAPENRL
jgi:DNA-binding Lrp family transcriptional regulator